MADLPSGCVKLWSADRTKCFTLEPEEDENPQKIGSSFKTLLPVIVRTDQDVILDVTDMLKNEHVKMRYTVRKLWLDGQFTGPVTVPHGNHCVEITICITEPKYRVWTWPLYMRDNESVQPLAVSKVTTVEVMPTSVEVVEEMAQD